MGADYIEPDLVSTKDHVLVARHENEVSGTTDVADRSEFADRKTTKVIDGVSLVGWFTEDFTLAELRTLRAKERIPAIRQRNTIYDGRYRVPTFDGVVWLAKRLSRELGRTNAGLVVHPYTFRNENTFLPLELRRGADPAAWGDAVAEYEQFFGLGVDGVFSDYPDTAVEAREGPTD